MQDMEMETLFICRTWTWKHQQQPHPKDIFRNFKNLTGKGLFRDTY